MMFLSLRIRGFGLVAVVACAVGLAAPAFAQTILRVDSAASTGGDGTSWPDAYKFLQDAIDRAVQLEPDGENIIQIWVAAVPSAGAYFPDDDETSGPLPDHTANSTSESFQLHNHVEMYGGFLGLATGGDEEFLSERDFVNNVTTLSGDIDGDDLIDDQNSQHVVKGNGTDESAILDGFTVKFGNARGSGENAQGGGILCGTSQDLGTPTIINCIIYQLHHQREFRRQVRRRALFG